MSFFFLAAASFLVAGDGREMALKAQAEVNLVQALNQNKARSASVYLKEQQHLVSNDGEHASEEECAVPTKLKPATEKEVLIAEVRQLEHHVTESRHYRSEDPAGGDEFSQIKQNALRRRDMHMERISEYERAVKDISERVEVELIKASDHVKEALAETDERLAAIENEELRSREQLLTASKQLVAVGWDRMESLTEHRTHVIADFSSELQRIEASRVADIRKQLERLTYYLMEIAHALGPEVERIIEGEAHEVNVVVIGNRKMYADLVARLATANVDVFVRSRLVWEQAFDHWRALRHAQAIDIFQQTLKSPSYKDPEDRQNIMVKIREHQQQTHDKQRLAALKELEDAKASLTSEHVQRILERLQQTQQQEEEANQAFFTDLLTAHESRVQDAHRLQEMLRLELHGFGALAKEGEIDEAKQKLNSLLETQGSALEDFFRMAGALKSDLESVAKRLEVSELIYEEYLTPLTIMIRLLISALPLENVMETQGKGAERRAVQMTLDKIRKASKGDIPALLPPLQAQMQVFLSLEEMNDVFRAEVEALAAELAAIIQECGVNTASLNSTATKDLTMTSSSATRTGSPGKPDSAGTTLSPLETASTRQMSSSVVTSADLTVQVDLQAVRRVQRRLATLAFASELPKSMHDQLQFISDQLVLQLAANNVIDAVIHSECDELLVNLQTDGKGFLEGIGRRMEHQSVTIHSQCEKLAKFHLSVITTVEQTRARASYVDLSVLDLLDTLKDKNDDLINTIEEKYSQGCAAVRHAPDQHALQARFRHCADLLAQMEEEYRAYEARVRVASKNNVVAGDAQRLVFLRQLASLVGLVVPDRLDPIDEIALTDVDSFLSVKFVEDIVSPPPLVTGTGSSNEDEAEVAHETAAETAGIKSAPGDTTAEQPHPSSLDANSSIEELEVYHLPSGTVLRCLFPVHSLLEHILHAIDPDDEETTGNGGDEEARLESQSASPSQTEPNASRPSNDEAVSPRSNDASPPQQLIVQAQIAREWLPLNISMEYQESLVRTFRDAILSAVDSENVAASVLLTQLRDERFESASTLLEERLRTHWPRRGRIDVQLFQPRLSELETHRQRTDRHLRGLESRAEAQQNIFDKRAEAITREIARERDVQVAFQAQLPLQASLAALQGLEARTKKSLAVLKSTGGDKLAALSAMIDSDTMALVTSSAEYVRACTSQIFPDLSGCEVISGCDYHPEEVADIQRMLSEYEQRAKDQISQRSARISSIRAELEAVLTMWPTFKTRYQACLQSLSMKEGLGQKFGLPRRAAQEQFRSEVTRCEEKSAAVNKLLENLQELCGDSKHEEGDDSHQGKSRQILIALLQLRAKVFQRGIYFGLLKNTSQIEPCSIEYRPDQNNESRVILDVDVVDEYDRLRPSADGFLGFVRQVSDQCRNDTTILFQQEGKTDELPPSGVPDALEEYLAGQMGKATAFVAHQEVSFHEQIRKLSELLLVAPGCAIADALSRARREAKSIDSTYRKAIDTQYHQFTSIKTKHSAELRPQLCSANNAAALEELCRRERERSTAAVRSLQEFRNNSMAAQNRFAIAFEHELVALTRCLARLLDSVVMGLEDVKLLSGEEFPKDKRKSLKRLRKLARVLETGDPKEIPRSDKELELLRQLGEAPRFPKRAYAGIPDFGVARIFRDAQAQAKSDDEGWGISDAVDTIVASDGNDAVEDGSCEALLTPAHRTLMRARDAAYGDWVSFCTNELHATASIAHERLDDEIKWRTSWDAGIANMTRGREAAHVEVHGPE